MLTLCLYTPDCVRTQRHLETTLLWQRQQKTTTLQFQGGKKQKLCNFKAGKVWANLGKPF
jgi:hypothetical protein